MKWSTADNYSIDRKVIMAGTGLFLMLFLIVHLGLNLTIFSGDGGKLFDRTAEMLHQNWGLRSLELLVWGGFVLHIWQGISIARANGAKRSTSYAVSPSFSLDPARMMPMLGAIVLAFLLLHLYQFWLPQAIGSTSPTSELSQLVRSTLSQWWVVVIYVSGCLAVAAHLWHGWRSAAITLGVTGLYFQPLSVVGISLAIGLPLGLAAIPIALFTSTHARF